jgi:hypothetical protein
VVCDVLTHNSRSAYAVATLLHGAELKLPPSTTPFRHAQCADEHCTGQNQSIGPDEC